MLWFFIIFPNLYIPVRSKGQPEAEAQEQQSQHQVNPAKTVC